MSDVSYDPTIYLGAAKYYARGRPPYSAQLVSTLETEVGLDGSGRLLDVGCGPGILAIELAGCFDETVGLDPDADMLDQAAHRAAESGVENVHWVRSLAEDIPQLDLGTFRLVTFGQSFQWTDRERVAEAVYDILEPGGALALIVHTREGRPKPKGLGYPEIPHDDIHALIRRYLGPRRRAGRGFRSDPPNRYEDALARTRFGAPRHVFARGRPDIVRDVDGVVAGFFSMSLATPYLFGDQREAFEAELRALLAAHSATGLFWDWPGDTEILLARRSA
jgi:SAM-dependent methyltransferase